MHDERLLRRTADLAIDFLAGIDVRPVGAPATRAELLASLGGPLADDPADPVDVIEGLAAHAGPGIIASPGPRFFGFVIGGVLPAALAGDWLTSTWDQNAGVYAAGPAASVVEEIVGEWLLDVLGLPAGSGFGLTTGCQMAHFTCLAAARHAVLERAGWDVESRGLFGAPGIDVIVGEEAHVTLLTALQYLGLGADRVIAVPTDGQGRMRADAFADLLPHGDRPLIVCLQAGNVNTGAFDPLAEIIGLVRAGRPGAWVHVDGAFGLWAAVSPGLRHLLAGHEEADSWATDAHKWLNVPQDSGVAIVRDAATHRSAMSPLHAPYLIYGAAERDEFCWVPEFSRRARGFAIYAALRSLGRDGVRAQVERSCALARRMAATLAAAPGVRVLNDVILDQVLVRFEPPGDMDADDWTREVVRRVQDDGTCWLSGTTWQGVAAMRISVINWSTTEADIDRSAAAILRAAGG